MTAHTRLALTSRDRFLEAVEKEMIQFERRENEFRKKDREERAAELHLPVEKPEIRSRSGAGARLQNSAIAHCWTGSRKRKGGAVTAL
jgi:hypothetical protein